MVHSNRPGLYILMFITMMASCEAAKASRKTKSDLEASSRTQSSIQSNFGIVQARTNEILIELKKLSSLELRTENIQGTPLPAEKFYVIEGDTAYVEIDGKPVRDYFER